MGIHQRYPQPLGVRGKLERPLNDDGAQEFLIAVGKVDSYQEFLGQYAYSGTRGGFHIFMESRQIKTWRYSPHIREKGKLPPGNMITELVGKPGQRLPLWDETIFRPIHPG